MMHPVKYWRFRRIFAHFLMKLAAWILFGWLCDSPTFTITQGARSFSITLSEEVEEKIEPASNFQLH